MTAIVDYTPKRQIGTLVIIDLIECISSCKSQYWAHIRFDFGDSTVKIHKRFRLVIYDLKILFINESIVLLHDNL